MRVLVLAEYYPRAGDPARGVWAHRQTVAVRDAGADVRVLVLHRPLPPLRALREGDARAALRELRQPREDRLDGVPVEYLRYVSPPRPWSYATWGAWAAPWLARRLARLWHEFPFELIHAHYAVPAGDAARRAAPGVPLLVSVHGHDVFGAGASGAAVRRVLTHADGVLANSAGTAQRCAAAGARAVRIVHLGTDPPPEPAPEPPSPTLVTVAHLAARKRHRDVLEAMALLSGRWPDLRYVVVGDGPERADLLAMTERLGLSGRVEVRGALAPAQALAAGRHATLFVMPSVDEAFGVAYVEAMGAGVPAIGCRGEAGPEEISAAAAEAGGEAMTLVPPRDPTALAAAMDGLLSDSRQRARARAAARATVLSEFTWDACGAATLAAYRDSLPSPRCRPSPPRPRVRNPRSPG